MDYIIVSFCTNSPKYIEYGENLNKQLSLYNLNYEIDFLDFQYDTKVENCLFKSQFILEKLLKHKTTLIWMDIDSIINIDPTNDINRLIIQQFDVGLVHTPERPHPVSDAIHIYKYKDTTIRFLKYRDKINKSGTLTLAHRSLDQTFNEYKNRLQIINIRKYINTWFKAVFSANDSILEYK